VAEQARRLQDEGRLDEALVLLEPWSEEEDPDVAYRLGCIRLHRGELEEAEACLRRALALRFEDHRGHTNLGVVLDQQGRREEAIRAFRRAVQLAPQEPAPLLNLGALYGEMGRYEDAVRALSRSLELAPSFDALFNLALVRFRQMELAEAERLFDRAWQMRPRHRAAPYYLGLCRAKRGLLQEAAEAFESALGQDENLVRARFHLGKVYRRLGRGQDAVRELKRVARALPDDAQVHRELGMAYDSLSLKSESLKCFRRARMLDGAS
jgi:superkiller protein 3